MVGHGGPGQRPRARDVISPASRPRRRLVGPTAGSPGSGSSARRSVTQSVDRRAADVGEDLDPVAVRVEGVEAQVPGERVRSARSTSKPERRQPRRRAASSAATSSSTQRRVRLARRRERLLDADVDLGGTAPASTPEPRAAAGRAVGRLRRPRSCRARRRRTGAPRPRRRAGMATWTWWSLMPSHRAATTKIRRNGSTTPYGVRGVGRPQPALELLLERSRRSSGSACSVGRAPVPETQVKTGSSPVQHVEVRRLPGVDRRSPRPASTSR